LQAEREREEWTEKNGGILFDALLQAVDADDELAAAKAHRYCDKVWIEPIKCRSSMVG
jgi:hypothetical protein